MFQHLSGGLLSLLTLGLCLLCAAPAHASTVAAPLPTALLNAGFEDGQAGDFPPGWTSAEEDKVEGFQIRTVDQQPARGKQSAQILPGKEGPAGNRYGSLYQSIDATPFRGRRIRFRAAVRAEVEAGKGRAQLWARVDRANAQPGFYESMADRPITSPRWEWYEIVGDVALDAERITVGILFYGQGAAWIDSASLEAVDEAAFGNEPPRALTGRGLENLVAVARLLSYLRFFHPSDQAAKARWPQWALAGMAAAEEAQSPEDLARRLEKLIRPIAPTVQVFPTGNPPPAVSPPRPPDAGSARGQREPRVVAWRHVGVEMLASPQPYESRRIDNRPPEPSGYGLLTQSLDARPYRGKQVRFRAAVRAQVEGRGKAQLWIRVLLPERKVGFFQNMHDRPITSGQWHTYEIFGEVPPNAEEIDLGLMLHPRGRVWIDEASLEVVGDEGKNLLENSGFEEAVVGGIGGIGGAGGDLQRWDLAPVHKSHGFRAEVSAETPFAGKSSACLSFQEPRPPVLPKPEEPFVADLGGGVSARIPLALYADDGAEGGTLPHVAVEIEPPLPGKPKAFFPSGKDRTSRFAIVALTWGVFQHFYPHFEAVEVDWNEALRRALQAAATDETEQAFLRTLQAMVAQLQDGQSIVSNTTFAPSHRLPLLWEWIEDRLVLTEASETTLRPGDVVLRIGGRPVAEVLAEQEGLSTGSNPASRRYHALIDLTLGNQNEPVRLEIQRGAEAPFTVTVPRSTPIIGELDRGIPEQPRQAKIAELKSGIYYVDLVRSTDEDLAQAKDRLAQAQGIVFDLRGYPSVSYSFLQHLLDQPASSPGFQIAVVQRPDRADMKFETSYWPPLLPLKPRFGAKVAFLADIRTAGGSETSLEMVEHYKLADIVGTQTAGTSGNFNTVPLPGGYYVLWTGIRILKQDGSLLHGNGIAPTIPATRTVRGVAEGRDELLEKALETVSPSR
jgi:C-terminal processing protease CtpA/Prc